MKLPKTEKDLAKVSTFDLATLAALIRSVLKERGEKATKEVERVAAQSF